VVSGGGELQLMPEGNFAMLRTNGNIKDYLEGVEFKDHPE
jgi:hypothetical protein